MSLFSDLLSVLGLNTKAPHAQRISESKHSANAQGMKDYVANNLGEIYSTVKLKMLESGDPLTIIIVGPTKLRTYHEKMNTTRGVKTYTTNFVGDQYLLVTAGMSDRPQYGRTDDYCELIMGLPSTWKAPKNQDDLSSMSPDDLYPLNMLLKLAEAPRLLKQAIGTGDTLSLGEGFSGKGFNRVLLDMPVLPNADTPSVYSHLPRPSNIGDVRNDMEGYMSLLGVYPITDQEFSKMEMFNSHHLMDHLNRKGVGLTFDMHRESTVSDEDANRSKQIRQESIEQEKNRLNNPVSFEEILKKKAKALEKYYSPFGQIKVISGDVPALKDSKFGGEPFWPKGLEYPTTPDGLNLVMLAQINCADVPEILGWPKKGIVQFYIRGDDDLYGADLDDPANQTGFRVIFHEDLDQETEKHPIDPNNEFLPLDVSKPKKIEILAGKMLPSIDASYVDPKLSDLIEDNGDAYSDYRDRARAELFGDASKHQIGGYPDFIQQDPRTESQAKSQYACLLLQIDSDPENNIQWGDYGSAQFFTSSAKLKKKDFSKALYSWAC